MVAILRARSGLQAKNACCDRQMQFRATRAGKVRIPRHPLHISCLRSNAEVSPARADPTAPRMMFRAWFHTLVALRDQVL